MSQPLVAAYTIGQTPRPDLTVDLSERFTSVRFEIVGALDGLQREEIPACPTRGYPLETRLQDGTRVVVDAAFVEPLLQQAIDERDADVAAHLVLCAGPFPKLAATTKTPLLDAARAPLILPFDVAVTVLKGHGYHHLDVVLPFADQVPAAMDKWGVADFACRAHVFTEKPRHRSVTEWLSGLVRATRAQALVFDYVGFSTETLDEVAAEIDLPVVDLGRLALDALEQTLKTL